MTQHNSPGIAPDLFQENLQNALAAAPPVTGDAASALAPAVADVMGGIAEDSESLVLTSAVGLSFHVSIWRVAGNDLTIRLVTESGRGASHDAVFPIASIGDKPQPPRGDTSVFAGREWAAPVLLTLSLAVKQKLFQPATGLMVLVQTDFPPDVDWGRHAVLAAATIDALCRLESKPLDRAAMCRLCSDAVEELTIMSSQRIATTALAGTADSALLQIHFRPQLACEPLSLPSGIIIVPVRTTLTRPVTRERMLETRLCTEMGRQVIQQYHDQAGLSIAMADRLSAITPTEFVDRYRDVLPQKITGKQFVAKFGELRGLNGDLCHEDVYKVRSRVEHHIYESIRVHEFATAINRARRSSSPEALTKAGELMYASHWSHSQRCGIGGVETDRFISCIKAAGPASGVYGAKVTGGGAGGEMVVLMRDDPTARAALAKVISDAQSATNRTIHTYRSSRAC